MTREELKTEEQQSEGDEWREPGEGVPKEAEIKIVVVHPDAPPQVVTIPNQLAELQKVVDGLIEVFPIGIEGAIGICNEEGLLRRLPWCRFVPAAGTIIAGTFFIVGAGHPLAGRMNFRSLTPRQINEALKLF